MTDQFIDNIAMYDEWWKESACGSSEISINVHNWEYTTHDYNTVKHLTSYKTVKLESVTCARDTQQPL